MGGRLEDAFWPRHGVIERHADAIARRGSLRLSPSRSRTPSVDRHALATLQVFAVSHLHICALEIKRETGSLLRLGTWDLVRALLLAATPNLLAAMCFHTIHDGLDNALGFSFNGVEEDSPLSNCLQVSLHTLCGTLHRTLR